MFVRDGPSENSWISHEVTAAMLVSPNNEMAAMLVSRSNPPGIESYYYAKLGYSFLLKIHAFLQVGFLKDEFQYKKKNSYIIMLTSSFVFVEKHGC